MTKEYYLRIEGVNLSNFVYDTQDLSTIRGGGLKLLDSIEDIKCRFRDKLESISTGASSGFFKINSDNPEKAKEEIEGYINNNPILKHATFVIDIIESDEGDKDSFVKARESLIALNRWQQMQSPSIAVPSQKSNRPCWIDMVRPAIRPVKEYKDKQNVLVSKSVYYRRKYGIIGKRKFYEKATGIELEVVNDLDELTKIADDKSQDPLNHKMAVIYIDGNGFGKKQEDTKNPDELRLWDATIKIYRKEMLTELIKKIKDKPKWKNNGKHRIETLLWGGDELIWVVPAWVGWWTLGFFYEQSKDWNFDKERLTHAAGIVFCHHNAPIHRITKLAHELAELAKHKRDESLFVYQRLESFDHIGKDIGDYINETYGGKINPKDFAIKGTDMPEIEKHIKTLREYDFSKSRMYKIAQSIVSGSGDAKSIIESIDKTESDPIKGALERLKGLLNGKNAMWIHLVELWDYMV